MYRYPQSIENLIREFNKLPGVGQKTSERYIFYLLRQPKEALDRLGESLEHLKETVITCAQCRNYADTDPCSICADPTRDRTVLCVVAESPDVLAIERTGAYRGRYHVLGGLVIGASTVSPQDLSINELVERIQGDGIREVLIATNPDLPGDTTALFLQEKLRDLAVTLTRLGRGLPLGGDISYADEETLKSALRGRQQMERRKQP